MHANPDGELVALYRAAQICQAFPAYKLEDVARLPVKTLWAMELVSLARQAQAGG